MSEKKAGMLKRKSPVWGQRGFLGALAAATAGLLLPNLPVLGATEASLPPQRPNIVVILADDMGYSDIGCYGGEVKTPNLDRLASGGLRFTQCYNTSRCCPSRACLLTGLYSHETGVGDMLDDRQLPSYRGFLNDRCMTIAEAVKQVGYTTLMCGKWHVGMERPTWPCKRGFDESYGLLAGGSYFHPTALIRNDQHVEPEGEHFYTTDALSSHAVEFLDKYGRGEKPFFLYLAYTAPHWPLQAWPEDIKKYEELYKKGWDELRPARYQRMLQMGLAEKGWQLSPTDAPPWQTLPNKEEMSHRMAVYAAQIDRMDQGIGKVLAKLKEIGAQDNTVVLFLSDNGGCAEVVERTKGVPAGGPDSFLSYTKNWANVSNTPYRRYKSEVHDGGISTPLIAYWPAVITRGGSLNNQVTHIVDIMPTCLELSGAQYPTTFHDKPLLPLEGRSFVPLLRGESLQEHGPLYWEHEGDRAVRVGKWKLVASREKGPWELYDMEADRTELHDLSAEMPEKVKELAEMYQKWADRVGAVPPSKLPAKLKPTTKPAVKQAD